jgi:hypothetical protein
MTDVFSEEAGRAVVAQVEFNKQAIWLPLLAIQHQNAGQPIIKGKVFKDCLFEGPALMVPVKDCSFDGCNMGVFKDANSLFYTPKGPVLIGAIPFEDCKFINCRFSQVGFTGHPDFLQGLADSLSSAAEAK